MDGHGDAVALGQVANPLVLQDAAAGQDIGMDDGDAARLQQRQENLTKELAGATVERQLEIMAELGKLNSLVKRINVKLGRIRKE